MSGSSGARSQVRCRRSRPSEAARKSGAAIRYRSALRYPVVTPYIIPIAIGVGEDSFWPSLAVAHEIGHFVDHAGLPGTGYQSAVRTMPEDSLAP